MGAGRRTARDVDLADGPTPDLAEVVRAHRRAIGSIDETSDSVRGYRSASSDRPGPAGLGLFRRAIRSRNLSPALSAGFRVGEAR